MNITHILKKKLLSRISVGTPTFYRYFKQKILDILFKINNT